MGIDLCSLYDLAEQDNIDVAWFPLQADRSMAIQMADGSCAIAIDPWKMETLADEATSLGHELGHCETGSFYNPFAALDVRQKHENRADKWAIQHLVPRDELSKALAAGHRDTWDLADCFNVSEQLIKKALCFYAYGNLNPELYL